MCAIKEIFVCAVQIVACAAQIRNFRCRMRRPEGNVHGEQMRSRDDMLEGDARSWGDATSARESGRCGEIGPFFTCESSRHNWALRRLQYFVRVNLRQNINVISLCSGARSDFVELVSTGRVYKDDSCFHWLNNFSKA